MLLWSYSSEGRLSICVRGMEHAVRQCEAQRSTEAIAQCGMPRPLRQQGARPKK
ncbi:MAG: hypothetical protein RML38_01040 [Bacteroidia bacterium]|nr:hypothetical protein [Bacteroidia bacterium]